MNGDIALESVTFTYRFGDQRHQLTLTPREGDGECFHVGGIGSFFLRQRDMDRALGFHRPKVLRNFRINGGLKAVRDEGESWLNAQHEILDPGRGEALAWTIDNFCIHCQGCGWECYRP